MNVRTTAGMNVVLFAACLAGCPTAGYGQTSKKEARLQEYCPVFTNLKVSFLNSETVRYKGIKIRLSSREAFLKWIRDPNAYFDKDLLPQLVDLPTPERGIVQTFCPVNRTQKVSRKDPFVLYQGHKVFLFGESAVRKWNRDPERYVDEEILPQLKTKPPVDIAQPAATAQPKP